MFIDIDRCRALALNQEGPGVWTFQPTQWARACSPGRVREPWVKRACDNEAHAVGGRSGARCSIGEASVAHHVGLPANRANPGLRGLALGYMLSPTAWAEMSKLQGPPD